MLENRSFDNLLGNLYPNGLPPDPPCGKTFAGVTGLGLSNPGPDGGAVMVSTTTDHRVPYPDPGEEFDHITRQIYDIDPSSPPKVLPQAKMQGFVADYVEVLEATFDDDDRSKATDPAVYGQIMQGFEPQQVPALTTLATEFGVFDHWFASVPSQTWPNRAFWHAATSWGWVNNPSLSELPRWFADTAGTSLFNLLDDWVIYSDLTPAFTRLIHWEALKRFQGSNHFRWMEFDLFGDSFFTDCEKGRLPKYSFLEPHFVDLEGWHNDMHPSSYHSILYHETPLGSVLLGDELVARVYEAIRTSSSVQGNNWSNTLLIITFDEHGGCYDHKPPPTGVASSPPREPTAPDVFGFNRLGVRVPTVMVSAHIARNTVVNTQMEHCSFLRTMQDKWSLPSLGHRQDGAAPFTEVFTSPSLRDRSGWPNLSRFTAAELDTSADLSALPLNDLQLSYFRGVATLDPARPPIPQTVGEGADMLRSLRLEDFTEM